MAACFKCGGCRLVNVTGKTSDMCTVSVPSISVEYDGYVPQALFFGRGGFGDYIEFIFCANCGTLQIQEDLPISDTELIEALG